MTREEAIRYFKRHIELYCVTGICLEAEKMAIEALEQEPCGDAISRQAVLDKMKERDEELSSICPKDIKDLPPVIQQQKIGKWIVSDDKYFRICPFCNAEIDVSVGTGIYVNYDEVSHMNYCPNCGAKMQEVE